MAGPLLTTADRLLGATKAYDREAKNYQGWLKKHPDWEDHSSQRREQKALLSHLHERKDRVVHLVEKLGRENAREQRREQRENARVEREELRKIVFGLSDITHSEVQPKPIVPPVWQSAQHARDARQYTYLANNVAERKLASIPSRASVDSVMPWDTPPELPVSSPPVSRRPPPLPSSPAPSVLSSVPPDNPPVMAEPARAPAPSNKPLQSPFRYVKRSALSANAPETIAPPPIAANSAPPPVVDYPNYGRVPVADIPPLDKPVVVSPNPVPAPTPEPASIYTSVDVLFRTGQAGDAARQKLAEGQIAKAQKDTELRAEGYHPETFHPDYGQIPKELRTTRDAVRRDNERPADAQYAKLPTAPTNVVAPSADDGSVAPQAADVQGAALPRTPQEAQALLAAAGMSDKPGLGLTAEYKEPAKYSEYGLIGFVKKPPRDFAPMAYAATRPAIAEPAAPANADEYGRPASDAGYGVLPPGVVSSDNLSQWSEASNDGSNQSNISEAVYDSVDALPDDEVKENNDNSDLPPVTTAEAHAAAERHRQDPGQAVRGYGMLPDEQRVGGNYGQVLLDAASASAATSSTSVTRPRANAMSNVGPATNYGGMPSQPSQGSLSSSSSASSVKGAEASGAVSSGSKVGWRADEVSLQRDLFTESSQSPAKAHANRTLAEKIKDAWRTFTGKGVQRHEARKDNNNDDDDFQRGPNRGPKK